jgi:hypothetical protein
MINEIHSGQKVNEALNSRTLNELIRSANEPKQAIQQGTFFNNRHGKVRIYNVYNEPLKAHELLVLIPYNNSNTTDKGKVNYLAYTLDTAMRSMGFDTFFYLHNTFCVLEKDLPAHAVGEAVVSGVVKIKAKKRDKNEFIVQSLETAEEVIGHEYPAKFGISLNHEYQAEVTFVEARMILHGLGWYYDYEGAYFEQDYVYVNVFLPAVGVKKDGLRGQQVLQWFYNNLYVMPTTDRIDINGYSPYYNMPYKTSDIGGGVSSSTKFNYGTYGLYESDIQPNLNRLYYKVYRHCLRNENILGVNGVDSYYSYKYIDNTSPNPTEGYTTANEVILFLGEVRFRPYMQGSTQRYELLYIFQNPIPLPPIFNSFYDTLQIDGKLLALKNQLENLRTTADNALTQRIVNLENSLSEHLNP